MESGKKQKKLRVGDYVIDCRETADGQKCLIKWKNLKNESSTWEMKENVEQTLLEKFEDTLTKKVKAEESSVNLKGPKGSLPCGDKVCDLVAVDPKKHPNLGYKFQASWFKRLDNSTPQPSYVYSEELRSYDPQVLIDFYQKRVHFSVVDKQQLKIEKEKKKIMQQNKANLKDQKQQKNVNKTVGESNESKEVITINSNNQSVSLEEQASPKEDPMVLKSTSPPLKEDPPIYNLLKEEELITEVLDDNHFVSSCLQASTNKLVIVDFYTQWCKPCQIVTPLLKEVSLQLQMPLFLVQIDSDDNVDTYERYNIDSPPTVILIKNQKEISRFVGKKTKEQIIEFIQLQNV